MGVSRGEKSYFWGGSQNYVLGFFWLSCHLNNFLKSINIILTLKLTPLSRLNIIGIIHHNLD